MQNLLNARCSQVEKLQNNLNDQTEKLEALKTQLRSLTEELDSVQAEHERCQQNANGTSNMQEQVLELEHLLSREKSNTEVMMRAFQEQEEQWEKERVKLLSVAKKDSESEQLSIFAEENAQLKRKLEELQNEVNVKERDYLEALRQTEKRVSSATSQKTDFQSKIRELESQCEELKYSLKQKDEEIFVKEESLKQSKQEAANLEAKYTAAGDVERELRHHLGEVTQQLEWSKEVKSGETEGNNEHLEASKETLTQALSEAEKEV